MFLQSMREKTQSWVAYVIVGLLILSFALWGISSYFGSSGQNGPVAKVNGEKIPYANFVSAYHQFLQDAQSKGTAHLTPAQEKYAKRLVLNNMMQRLAIQYYITRLGFAVNQQQIDAALMAVPLFSVHGEFSPGLFKRFLVANNVSAQQFLTDFATRMTMAQWEEGISMTSFATPLELDNIISLLKQKRSIVYGIIKTGTKGLTPITSAEAQQFYDQHQRRFVVPERVKISYITLRLSDIIKSINPSNETLIKYYNQDVARFNVPERWQVDVIAMPQATIEQQGVWLAAANLNQDVKNALSHTVVNGVTPAFKVSENNYIAYKILKHQAAVNKQYYEVKSAVRGEYVNQEAQKRWNQMLEEMSNIAYEHPDNLDALVKKFNVNVKISDFFAQNYDGKQGLESNAEVVTAAFSDDVLAGGNNSDVIKLDQGKEACVLRVVDHVAAHEQSFSEVEKDIKDILLNEHAMQRAKEKAQQLQQALDAGDSLEKIQKTYGIILSQQTVNRFDHGLPSDILQQAFILPAHHAGVTKVSNTGFAAVQVLSITPGEISSVSAKERAMYKSVVTNEWAQAELSAYVRAIMKSAKVKVNKEELAASQ